ncbi:hypothetical protein ABSL23_15895 (plasmid) [Halobacterium sp. NMX12-1]|uniref:Uncharacterized protein n=1 Tax=Halobacterium sp. NMX12-1 TaxID=3166650 RepID=A0AAU8CGR3_9EURY
MLPVESPALKKAGYTNPTVLYVIFADGQVYADHDRHALVRELPGRNDWLHDHLKRLRSEVMA